MVEMFMKDYLKDTGPKESIALKKKCVPSERGKVRVRTLDVHLRWSVRLLCDVSHVRGQRKHLASSCYSMINRESIDEWASSVKTTTLFRLKETSMISPVGSCIVFLPQTCLSHHVKPHTHESANAVSCFPNYQEDLILHVSSSLPQVH